MTSWPTAQLGTICSVIAGGTPPRSRLDFYGGEIPWVKISDMPQGRILETEEMLTEAGLANSSAKLLPAGTVLISIFATIGRTAILGINAATNQAIAGITPNDPVILLPQYLHHFLDSVVAKLQSKARGVAQVNINSRILKTLDVPLPPIDAQREITELLDRVDKLRTKRRQAITLLDDLAQSIFLDMFGDPITNPNGWNISTLDELGQVQGGLQVTSKRKSYPIEVPYLRVANVYRNLLDLHEIKTIRVSERELKRTQLQGGDLLIVEGHGNADEIGRVAVWNDSINPCTHQNHLIRVRLTSTMSPTYACAHLNIPGGRHHLLRAASTTSGLNTISTSDVRSTPMMTPPAELQARYVERLSGVERLRTDHRRHLADLDELFASLQARAFRGEL